MSWLTSFQLTSDAIIGIKYVKHRFILDISDILRSSSVIWNPRPLGILKEYLGYGRYFQYFKNSNRNCIFPLLNSLLIITSSFFGSG